MKAVWPDTFVEESNLTSNISILRKHLGVSPDGEEYIETIPKRGYRFAASVTSSERQSEQLRVNVLRAEDLQRAAIFVGLAAIAVVALLYTARFRSKSTEGLQVISLAVLPLDNLSGDPDQEYFSDAMTEALTVNLAQISSLSVISRDSAMQFKGTKEPLRNIAAKLNVDAFIRGSVMRSGRRVKITAGLIRSSTDRYLWSKTYEDVVDDILSLQTQVARDIAHEINAKLTPSEQERLMRAESVNPEAYEAYSKGCFFWNQLTENSLWKSIEYFDQAKTVEPNYSEAYAGLADAWATLAYIGAASPDEIQPQALEAATTALRLNKDLAEAHAAMAILKAQDWDWKGAEDECRKAFELNPGYANAHLFLANELRYRGRTEESIAEAKNALKLDPLSALAIEQLADAYFSARQYDHAIEQYLKTLELFPDRPSSLDNLGWAHVYLKLYDLGIDEILKSGEDPDQSAELAYVYATRGDTARAEDILKRLQRLSKRTPVAAHHFALVYAGLNQRQLAARGRSLGFAIALNEG